MRRARVKSCTDKTARLSRRSMLKSAAAATLTCLGRPSLALAQSGEADAPTKPPPWWLGEALGPRSRVVDIRSTTVLRGSAVDSQVLAEMVTQGLRNLTAAGSAPEAWRTILGPAERILIKFNRVAAELLNTNDAMARVLVRQLDAAGYEPAKVGLLEVQPHVAKTLLTRETASGWGETIAVGKGAEPLASAWLEADAVINVPFLKTHQIAGMSCSMKNISHAVIRHPAAYHDNGCAPYIGQIISAQQVSSRIRLNLVNALRTIVEHGPDAKPEDVSNAGCLLLGFDPLAIDMVGLTVLNALRRERSIAGENRGPVAGVGGAAGCGPLAGR